MYQYLQEKGFTDPDVSKYEGGNHYFKCGCCGSKVLGGHKYLIYDGTKQDLLCKYCAEEYASDIWGDI